MWSPEQAMEKLKEYSKNTGLGLAIGTLWIYDKDNPKLRDLEMASIRITS